MSNVNKLTLVDDADKRIRYSDGWQAFTDGAEVEGTKHGATDKGMTATFDFVGTYIAVVGSLGSVDVHGVPSTSYDIDGDVVGAYKAPVIQPGFFDLNITFFSSDVLPAGKHKLTITNLNGTAPNVYWLDYVLYSPSALPSSTDSSSPASSPTSSSATSEESSSSGSRKNLGAIIGGSVGGAVALLLAGVLLWFCIRRRRARPTSVVADGSILPFAAWRDVEPRSPSSTTTTKEIGDVVLDISAAPPAPVRVGVSRPHSAPVRNPAEATRRPGMPPPYS